MASDAIKAARARLAAQTAEGAQRIERLRCLDCGANTRHLLGDEISRCRAHVSGCPATRVRVWEPA